MGHWRPNPEAQQASTFTRNFEKVHRAELKRIDLRIRTDLPWPAIRGASWAIDTADVKANTLAALCG
jgi:hypothetical protein